MDTEFDIYKLFYVEILNSNAKALVYPDLIDKYYINISSNTMESGYKKRFYNKANVKRICNFYELLKFNNLWVILIDSRGIFKTSCVKERIMELLGIYKKLVSLNEIVSREVDYITTLVADKCINNILISDKNNCLTENKEIMFTKLLRSYLYIDMAVNGLNSGKLIIRKEDKMIDYKILRILKFLEVNIDIKDIPDFKMEYNLEGINYYDSNGNKTTDCNLDKEEVEKVKKLVDKRTI